MAPTPFDTTQPSQVKGLNGYTVDPIFTVGDVIDSYVPLGILDGLGAYKLNSTTVRVLANHEVSNTAGYAYNLANNTSLVGSRVSYFDINKSTLKIVKSGLAYDTIYNRAGEIVDAAADLEYAGINRLCSAQRIEANQFGAGKGLVDTIFFTGEEATGVTEFALDVATNKLWALPWLGRAAWESVTEVDTGTKDQVAFLIGDDRSSGRINGVTFTPVAPMLLYVGTKDTTVGASFLDRNGLANGKLYVWVADDPAIKSPANFSATGSTIGGKFVEIKYYDPTAIKAVDGADAGTSIQDNELGYDAQGFATQSQQDKLAMDAGAFRFARPEDLATNPHDGTQVVLASTGNGSSPESDTYGTTYIFDLNFKNIKKGDISATVNILYAGDDSGGGVVQSPDFGLRSPDNLEWADDGFIYLQEDDAVDASIPDNISTFGGVSGQEASIFRIDPSASKPASTLTRIAQIDRTALPATQTDNAPTDIGNWETSGITDVSKLFDRKPGELFIFDVQAHSLRNGNIASQNLVQGGQLSFLTAPTPIATELKLKKNSFDTINVSGGINKSKTTVSFSISSNGANQVSELGVFLVDDAEGTIDGLSPDKAGYAEKALSRAKVVFSAIANNPDGFSANGINRKLEFNNFDKLRFYSINDKSVTTDSVLKTKSFDKVTFSSTTALNLKESSNSEFSIAFNGLNINVKAGSDSMVLGTGLQDTREGEVLDFRNVDTKQFSKIKADFVLNREAAYNNFIGFYQVENAKGDIKKADGMIVSVGQAGYTQAAISGRVAGMDLSVANQSTQTSSGIFNAGSIFAPFIIINDKPAALLDNNTSNDPNVYFSYLGANTDGIDHIRLLANNTFGFEDLAGGGDFDYNDFIVKVNVTPVA